MFLKEISLLGFKSFPDKVKITFTPGMTCIVGPNGCGKSNITDALRWVFGEQSAKKLRGGRMQDVIFSGTSDRKPLNLSEVHVVLDNEKHLLPSEYNEVSISRKLFSDGDSEYYINKQKVRMRDVQEMITDTGIGMSAYSFIEQGMISQILSTKAEERRAIFEEAAGIMKYRVRKKETTRKLDTTRENLNRLKDIFFEVERQLKTLERQVEKARQYKEIYTELKERETALYAYQHINDTNEKKQKEKELKKIKADNSSLMVEMNKLSADNESLQYQLMQEEEERSRKESALYESKMALERLKNTIERLEREIEFNERQNDELNKDNQNIETENHIASRRIADLKRELRRLDMEKTGAEEQVIADEESLDALRSEIARKEEEHQEKVAGLLENMRDQSNIKGRISAIEADLNNIQIRIQRLEGKNLQLDKEMEDVGQSRSLKEKELQEKEEQQKDLICRQEEEEKNLKQLSRSLEAAEKSCQEMKNELQTLKAKLEGLDFLERKREGYQEGTKAILENKDEFRVETILADYIKVKKGFEPLVDRILSEKGQALIGDSQSLDRLKAFLSGRGKGEGFYFVSSAEHDAAVEPGSLYEKCQASHPHVDAFLRHTLGKVIPLQAGQSPLSAKKELHYIDPDGTVIFADGLISYADVNHQGPGIVSRKTLQNEYKKEIASLEKQVTAASGSIEKEKEKKNAAEARKEKISVARRAVENEINRIAGEIDFLTRELHRNETETATNKKEIELLSREIEGLQSEKVRLQGLYSQSTQAGETEENVKLKLQESLRGLREEQEKRQGEMMAHRARLSEINADLLNKQRDFSRIESQLIDNAKRQEANNAKINENNKKNEENKILIEESKGGVSENLTHIDDQEKIIVEKKGIIEEIKEIASSAVARLRSQEEKFRKVQEILRDAEVYMARLRDRIENNEAYIREKYDMDLNNIVSPSSDEFGLEEEKERVKTLQQKIKSLGNVNLSALEEYTELKKRYDFLIVQKSDLESAKGQLEEAIGKIDQISKEKFLDTFYKISENFKQIFPLLFNGGKADITLVMEDSDDVLEAGIDVNVKPPGKRLQNIDLLSGGEKALSAIALLFSIFKVKPAPFCVLDEIDAPLDDANIARFIHMLSEFTQTTQFIIVSHNKYTMEMADALYGVTMDEPGVSKIVSVQFREGA